MRAPSPVWTLALALLAWLPTVVRAGFAGDDRELLFQNPVVDGALPWTEAFARDYFHHVGDAGQWRPLATLSFRLERAFWARFGLEREPTGYHLGNALLHGAVALLAALALRRRARAWPWLGLALFAVHPALADSVAWISGRTSMVSALPGAAGALALVLLLERGRERAAGLAAAIGTFAAGLGKEDGLLFAGVYLMLAAAHSRRALVWTAAGGAAGIALYLAGRGLALGAPLPRASSPVLTGAALPQRAQLGGAAALEALRLAALPFGYPPQYRPELVLARAGPLGPALGWLALASCAGLGIFALFKRPSAAAASALLAPLALLPVLHLVPLGEAFAPRFLYLPLLLAAPLVHGFLARLPRALALASLALFTLGAWQRAGVYASRASYRLEVLRHQPEDARSWSDLGVALEEAGELDAALDAWRRASALAPDYSRPWSNLGRAALEAGDLEEAERCLSRAVEVGPANPTARVNLGGLLLRRERLDDAAAQYREAARLAPGFAPAWRGLGSALLAGGVRDEAAAAFERALALDPGDERARRLLAQARGR